MGYPMTNVQDIETKIPNQDLIAQVSQLLALARSGEIVGMLGITVYHDGTTSDHWFNPTEAHQTKIVSRRVIGELECLKLEMMAGKRWVEREEIFG